MDEFERTGDIFKRLKEIYGDGKVAREPRIEGTLTPDFIVYNDTEWNDPYLVVEYKGSLSYRRSEKGFEQLQRALRELDCKFGALISPGVEYIFEWTEDETPEQSLGQFPQDRVERTTRRPIHTRDEARFLIDRVLNTVGNQRGKDLDIHEIYQVLLQKLAAENLGLSINYTEGEDYQDEYSEINNWLRDRYDAFELVDYASYDRTIEATLAVFSGFELGTSAEEAIEELSHYETAGSAKLGEHQTKSNLVHPMLRLADIQPGMSVLDPAAGMGNIVREAAGDGATGYAVEIVQSVVNSGIFLASLSDVDLQYTCGDFFELARNTISESNIHTKLTDFEDEMEDMSEEDLATLPGPGTYDRIVLDPPVGVRMSSEKAPFVFESNRTVRSEEAFISQALDLLEPNGILVAVVPETILAGERTRELREFLLSDYSIESIITFEGSIYSGSQAKAGFLTIRNDRTPGWEQRVKVGTIDDIPDGDLEKALHRAIDDVQSDDPDWITFDAEHHRTLLPRQVRGLTEISEDIYEEYGSITSLEDAAMEVIGGISQPEEQSTGDSQRVPYLSPLDLEEGEPDPPTVSVDAARVVADETDVLLRVKGKPLTAHRPESKIVPSSDWAVVRFNSTDRAEAYLEFFSTDFAERAVSANRRGSIVPYITIAALRDIPVPELTSNSNRGNQA